MQLFWGWVPLPLTWDRRSQRHKHHSRHRVLQSYCAAKVWRQIAGDRRQDADKRYGDNEAGPAVPVLRGRDEGEQNFPEDGEEVHDVVEAGRQPLLAALLLVVVSFGEEEQGDDSKTGEEKGEDKNDTVSMQAKSTDGDRNFSKNLY